MGGISGPGYFCGGRVWYFLSADSSSRATAVAAEAPSRAAPRAAAPAPIVDLLVVEDLLLEGFADEFDVKRAARALVATRAIGRVDVRWSDTSMTSLWWL